MEKRSSTVTLELDEYTALVMHFEKINAVERLLKGENYATVGEIAAILDIDTPKTEESIK